MNSEQAEASSSTSLPAVHHQVTFAIDSSLTRERYETLVETEGVMHKIVQRLLEKHAEASVGPLFVTAG
jgi:hypothetical protein